jgi:hypothetical protein
LGGAIEVRRIWSRFQKTKEKTMTGSAEQRPSNLQSVLVLTFFGLFFYQWGAANLEGFFNYPYLRDIGELLSKEDWIRTRSAPFAMIFPLLVIPFALSILATVALAFLAPSYIPRKIIFVILGLQAVIAASTILIQGPIQFQLNSGFDRDLIDRLIVTDFWLRKVPLQIEGAFVLYTLWRVVAR